MRSFRLRQPAPALLPPLLSLALVACQPQPAPSITSARPTAKMPAATAIDLVARGEYLVRIAGCNDCHTPAYAENQGKVPKEHWLTGSPLGFNGPWGTTYPTNLRLRMQDFSEEEWLAYSANLRTRPLMPDFAVRDMTEDDRRALYRFIHGLGPAGTPAPAALPPGKAPPLPHMALVLPATASPAGAAAGPAPPGAPNTH